MKTNGASTTNKLPALTADASAVEVVRLKACTKPSSSIQSSRNQRKRFKVGLLNGTNNPTRKKAEIQLPPSFGKSFCTISRPFATSFCQKSLVLTVLKSTSNV